MVKFYPPIVKDVTSKTVELVFIFTLLSVPNEAQTSLIELPVLCIFSLMTLLLWYLISAQHFDFIIFS